MIEIINLELKFNEKVIFSDLNLKIERGEKIGIKGESGKGKTSLLNLIMGFISPNIGKILIDKSEISHNNIISIRNKMAYLPQNILLMGDKNVLDAIEYPFHYSINKKNKPKEEKIISELEKINLKSEILSTSISKISGGEKQRIALVIAKLLGREIFLLDEPTSALDEISRKSVMKYVFESNDTVVSVSHDNEWLNKCSKIINF